MKKDLNIIEGEKKLSFEERCKRRKIQKSMFPDGFVTAVNMELRRQRLLRINAGMED